MTDLVKAAAMTSVVDVGANPIHETPPYQAMLELGICTLAGFEPQAEALAKLNAKKGPRETYLPYAIGDGQPGKLTLCHADGMSSLLEPNPEVCDCLHIYPIYMRVVGKADLQTHRLDDIDELPKIDYLKIDVQGAEMSVFRGGRARLSSAVAVQTEVCFMQLYKGQALFGEIDRELRSLGLVPHIFYPTEKVMISPLHVPGHHHAAMNQAVFRDVVYVRDFTKPELMSVEQLKQLSLIAHYCFGSFDLAIRCLGYLEQRNHVPAGTLTAYAEGLRMDYAQGLHSR
jgi:FkbM family methyltransferase